MKKYWAALVISLKEDTVYSLSVLAWRVRTVLWVLVVYILWSSFLVGGGFGLYSRSQILSYILLTIVVRTVVFSSRTIDVSANIASGDLSNLLLKPINYFKYYLSQDLGNKGLNLIFSFFEFAAFLYFFKPPFLVQKGAGPVAAFFLALLLAIFIYYFVNILQGFLAFYIPENVWAPRFLFFMSVDFLAGGLFPLDLLPAWAFKALMLTPFPYLLYFPSAVYLGRFAGFEFVYYSGLALAWLLFLFFLAQSAWYKGLKVYEAWGR